MADQPKARQRGRIRFTVRRLMLAVAICAAVLWIVPVGYQWWWTWSVTRDARRGVRRYSPLGYWSAGPGAVRALRETVRSGQRTARIAAIQTLGDFALAPAAAHRDMAKPAIPELVEALRDKDDEIRMWAAITLGQIGPDAVRAVEPLISLLQVEENPQVILCAVRSLGEIGPGARSALPALTAIAEDSRHFARGFAIQAIQQVSPQAGGGSPPAVEDGPR
jgi:hypothetical protein